MMARTLKEGWSMSSLAVKTGAIAICLIVALMLIGSTAGIVSHFKDRAADKAIAAERAKSEEHRQRADEAEAKAKEFEAQRALAEMAVQAAGSRAEAIAGKVKDADKALVDEMQRIGEPVADPCERVRRVCVRLNIPPADCVCTSN